MRSLKAVLVFAVCVLAFAPGLVSAGTIHLADFNSQKQLTVNSDYRFDFTIPMQFDGIQPSAYDAFTCDDLYQVYYYVTAQQWQDKTVDVGSRNPAELRAWSIEGKRLYEIDRPLAIAHFQQMIESPDGSAEVHSFLRQQLAMLESGGVVDPLYVLAAARMWRNDHP